jgi:ribosomal protein S18 acetylase RimI-like enzyme
MRTVEIRAAAPADVESAVELIGAVAAENAWIQTEVPFNAAARRRRMAEALATGKLTSFIAHSGAEVVGELSLGVTDDRASLGMVVAAAMRGQGVGRQLLAAAVAWAREQGVTQIDLVVYAHNVVALGLYRSLGFVESGPHCVEVRHDGQRWEAIPMLKTVS